jgi:hypothetical protein
LGETSMEPRRVCGIRFLVRPLPIPPSPPWLAGKNLGRSSLPWLRPFFLLLISRRQPQHVPGIGGVRQADDPTGTARPSAGLTILENLVSRGLRGTMFDSRDFNVRMGKPLARGARRRGGFPCPRSSASFFSA